MGAAGRPLGRQSPDPRPRARSRRPGPQTSNLSRRLETAAMQLSSSSSAATPSAHSGLPTGFFETPRRQRKFCRRHFSRHIEDFVVSNAGPDFTPGSTESWSIWRSIAVAETGVIGVPLPTEAVLGGIGEAAAALSAEGAGSFSDAILTTDRWPKSCTVRAGAGRAVMSRVPRLTERQAEAEEAEAESRRRAEIARAKAAQAIEIENNNLRIKKAELEKAAVVREQEALVAGEKAKARFEQEVEQEVLRCLRAFGPGGGYILAPAHYVQADVPPANLVSMCRTVHRYGRYPILGD